LQHDFHAQDEHFLRDTLTSSGLHPSLCSDERAHPSFKQRSVSIRMIPSILQDQTFTSQNDTPQLSLGIFNSAASGDEFPRLNPQPTYGPQGALKLQN